MAHFAKIENNMVTQVIVAEQDFIDTLDGVWVQTSYNSRGGKHYDPSTGLEDDKPHLRYNYAGIGYTYDEVRDAFISPKPYDSWTFNELTCLWDSPIPYPKDGKYYYWDEKELNWVEYNQPELELGE